MHPEVVAVLATLGLDTSGEACPFYAGAPYDDWELDDPKGQDAATVRRIVADIDGRVRALLVELLPDLQLPPSLLAEPAR